MHIEIMLPVSELKTALAGISKVVSKSSRLPVLQSIRIERDAAGVVTLQATDLDSFATYSAQQPHSGLPATLLVPLDKLSDAVKSSKEQVGFVIEGPEEAYLRSFISKTPVEEKIESLPVEDWPPTPRGNEQGFVLDVRCQQALKEAFECASEVSARGVLNGACLDVSQPDTHYLVGTDGRHLYAANTFRFGLQESLVVPNRKFLHWPGFTEEGDWCLALLPPHVEKGAWIKLSSPRWVFLTKAIEGNYPNWRKIVPDEKRRKTVITLNGDACRQLLEVIPRMPGQYDDAQPVHLRVQEGQFHLCHRSKQGEWRVEIPVAGARIDGEGCAVCLNRNYLLKALRMGCSVLELTDRDVPVVCRGEDKALYIAQVRTDDKIAGAPPEHRSSTADHATPQPEPSPSPAQEEESPPDPEPEESQTDAPPEDEERVSPTQASVADSETAPPYALQAIMGHLKTIRTALKEVVNDLDQTLNRLKTAQREQRIREKELASVLDALRELGKSKL